MEKHLISFLWDLLRIFFDCSACLLGYQILGGFSFSKKKIKWLVVIGSIMILYLLFLASFPSTYKEPLCILLFSLIHLLVEPPNRKRALAIYPFIYLATSAISVTLLMFEGVLINGKIIHLIYSDFYSFLLVNACMLAILLGILYYRKKYNANPIELTIRQYIIFYTTVFATVIILGSWQYVAIHLDTSRIFVALGSCTSIACLLLLYLVVYQAFLNTNHRLLEEKQRLQDKFYQMQQVYLKNKIKQDKQLRKFRHDYQAHMIILNTLIEKQDYTVLKNYLKKMNEYSLLENQKRYTGNLIIDSLLENSLAQAKSKGIKVTIYGYLPLELETDSYDLSVVFYNLFKNALEAAEKMPINQRWIEITVSEFTKCRPYLSIVNPVNHPIKIEDNTIVTSKHDTINHGLGLRNVKDIAKKYDNQFNLFYKQGTVIAEIFL
nr:GHKL domain-containing protein [Enterococcus cecorum]